MGGTLCLHSWSYPIDDIKTAQVWLRKLSVLLAPDWPPGCKIASYAARFDFITYRLQKKDHGCATVYALFKELRLDFFMDAID
jgi:hypothetical protein